MAGLEVNKQFFNEAFSRLKEEQKQLKNEVPGTASDKLEEKFMLLMKDVELSETMKKILGDNKPIEDRQGGKAPVGKRIKRRDDANGNGIYGEDTDGLNVETTLVQNTDEYGNPTHHEGINFYLLNGTKEISLNYEDQLIDNENSEGKLISFTISKTEGGSLKLYKTDKVKEGTEEGGEQFESITLQGDNIKTKIIAQIDAWFGTKRRTTNKSPDKPFGKLQDALEMLIS